jgi:PAS domain S-box-containing protein
MLRAKQRVTAPQEGGERSRALFKGVPVPTYAWKKVREDFVLVDYNDAAEVVTKGDIKDLIGVTVRALYPDMADIETDMARCFRERTVVTRHMRYRMGATVTCELAVIYGFVPPDTVVVHAQDITDTAVVEAALQDREAQLSLIFQHLPGSIWTTDRELRITSARRGAGSPLTFTPAQQLGRTIYDLFPGADPSFPPIATHLRALDGEAGAYDIEYLERAWAARVEPLRGADGLVIGCIGHALDVTERKRNEEALRASETRFRMFVEAAPDAIVGTDGEGRICLVNRQTEELFGYARAEVLDRPVEILIPDRFHTAHIAHRVAFHAEPRLRTLGRGVALYGRRKDGTEFPAEISVSPMSTSDGLLVMSIVRDITERKRVEEMLRALAERLRSTREEEQVRIAREIHDELSQSLTVLRIDLASLRTMRPRQHRALLEKTDQMIAVVDDTFRTMRRIVAELRPPTLEDLGLQAAIEWLTQRFSAVTHVACRLSLELEHTSVDIERAVTVYRILQEALTNIAQHAQATEAVVRCRVVGNAVVLEVRDNGNGFDEQEVKKGSSLGLLGMRERARAWDGDVEFHGAPGTGTVVSAKIPLAGNRGPSDDP